MNKNTTLIKCPFCKSTFDIHLYSPPINKIVYDRILKSINKFTIGFATIITISLGLKPFIILLKKYFGFVIINEVIKVTLINILIILICLIARYLLTKILAIKLLNSKKLLNKWLYIASEPLFSTKHFSLKMVSFKELVLPILLLIMEGTIAVNIILLIKKFILVFS